MLLGMERGCLCSEFRDPGRLAGGSMLRRQKLSHGNSKL